MQNGKKRVSTIGARIKRHRQDEGLGQAALALRLGISQSAISRIENGSISTGRAHDLIRDYLTEEDRKHGLDEILQKIFASPELRDFVSRVLLEGH
ncbi:helix-turn-helix domain-containing protein [Neogemmobacter tilapiae]|uniref:helix-turn-helix domain-containing protein n=1 Tax=Neogemmobacter tilapiae TaxID=875041 RepID=UPI001675FE66